MSLTQVLSDPELAEATLYLCGPAAFVQCFRHETLDIEFLPEQIHTELETAG